MEASAGGPGAKTTPSPPVRVYRAWRALTREQRVAALAALSLFITMFLPWYSETGFQNGFATISLSAWNAFGLVQAFVLFMSLGVLALLFARGEGRTFRLPGGDGANILVFAAFTAILVFVGVFDKPSGGAGARIATGVSWGIFLALFAAIWLAWTGSALRRAEQTSRNGGGPPLPQRRLTRRERSGGGEPPESARWVDPSRSIFGEGPPDPQPPRTEPAAGSERPLRTQDATQLSLELPADGYGD